jgi:hypothetical protein
MQSLRYAETITIKNVRNNGMINRNQSNNYFICTDNEIHSCNLDLECNSVECNSDIILTRIPTGSLVVNNASVCINGNELINCDITYRGKLDSIDMSKVGNLNKLHVSTSKTSVQKLTSLDITKLQDISDVLVDIPV